MNFLDISKQALGPEPQDSISAMTNRAKMHESQGEFHEAEELYRKCFKHQVFTLGENHGDCAKTIGKLAEAVSSQGRYTEAEKLCEWRIRKQASRFGDGHPETLQAMDSLAKIYQKQRKYWKAESLYRICLKHQRAIFGDGHPDTLKAINDLAGALALQGLSLEAEDLCRVSTENPNATLSKNHSGKPHEAKSSLARPTNATHYSHRTVLRSQHSKRTTQNDVSRVASTDSQLNSAFVPSDDLSEKREIAMDQERKSEKKHAASRKQLLKSSLDDLKGLPIELAMTSSDEGEDTPAKDSTKTDANDAYGRHKTRNTGDSHFPSISQGTGKNTGVISQMNAVRLKRQGAQKIFPAEVSLPPVRPLTRRKSLPKGFFRMEEVSSRPAQKPTRGKSLERGFSMGINERIFHPIDFQDATLNSDNQHEEEN